MPNVLVQQRLDQQSYHGLWTVKLCEDFSLSLAEAKVLSSEIIEEQARLTNSPLRDQEIWFTCIAKQKPAGKRLKDCQKVRVRLELAEDPDDQIHQTWHVFFGLYTASVGSLWSKVVS